MKINITLVPTNLAGYINVCPLLGHSFYNLDAICESNECVEIKAESVLNTIPHNRIGNAIQHWRSKLRKKGVIVLGGIDARLLCWNFTRGNINIEEFNMLTFGSCTDAWSYNSSMYTIDEVVKTLEEYDCHILHKRLNNNHFLVKAFRK